MAVSHTHFSIRSMYFFFLNAKAQSFTADNWKKKKKKKGDGGGLWNGGRVESERERASGCGVGRDRGKERVRGARDEAVKRKWC